MRTGLFFGTPLSSIATPGNSSYSTYATNIGASDQLPWITLWLDLDNDNVFNIANDDRLFLEPYYNTDVNLGAGNGQAASVLLNTWQIWDLSSGLWYSQNFFSGLVVDITTYLTDPSTGGATANARIIDPPGTGGFRIASGYASPTDVFNTNVDNLTFNGQFFDFEFFTVPELDTTQGTLPLTFALLTLGLSRSRRRKA